MLPTVVEIYTVNGYFWSKERQVLDFSVSSHGKMHINCVVNNDDTIIIYFSLASYCLILQVPSSDKQRMTKVSWLQTDIMHKMSGLFMKLQMFFVY